MLQLCTDFGACSETCGGGTQTCENSCQNGVFGDIGCPVESKMNLQDCNSQDCPGLLFIPVIKTDYKKSLFKSKIIIYR